MKTLGMFVKYPQAGQVKTRLAATLGERRASELYQAFVEDLSDRFRETANRRVLCYTPTTPKSLEYFENLAGEVFGLWPQPSGELGIRLAHFFEDHLKEQGDRAVVIGSDSPTLPREIADQAFATLEEHDCVLGPATDGGYYLIGLRDCCRDLFSGIEWSSAQVLHQTASRVSSLGLKLGLLPPWYDVDTAEDLQLLKGHVEALKHSGTKISLKRTKGQLEGEYP